MTYKDEIAKLKSLGWKMYDAYQYLTTDASHVRKAMKEWYDFINYEQKKEPADKDFEAALAEEWKGYNDRGAAKVDALEDNTQELAFAKGFYRGWNYPKVSVWHNASEEPLPNKELFCIGEFNNPLVLSSNSESFKNRKIIKWAYFDNLLKL